MECSIEDGRALWNRSPRSGIASLTLSREGSVAMMRVKVRSGYGGDAVLGIVA